MRIFKDLRFFVGSGTRKDGKLKNEDANFLSPVFPKSLVSRCGETNLEVPQVPQGRLTFGRGSSAGCEDDFEGHNGWAFSGASGAGRSETESEGSLHGLPNSLVAVGAGNVVGDADIAGENLQLAAFAEFGYLHRLNSRNSLICHPSMHAPSLARVIDGTSGRVCGTVSGEELEVC